MMRQNHLRNGQVNTKINLQHGRSEISRNILFMVTAFFEILSIDPFRIDPFRIDRPFSQHFLAGWKIAKRVDAETCRNSERDNFKNSISRFQILSHYYNSKKVIHLIRDPDMGRPMSRDDYTRVGQSACCTLLFSISDLSNIFKFCIPYLWVLVTKIKKI